MYCRWFLYWWLNEGERVLLHGAFCLRDFPFRDQYDREQALEDIKTGELCVWAVTKFSPCGFALLVCGNSLVISLPTHSLARASVAHGRCCHT